MSERKRAKKLWDEKMREHKGSTSEADYLYATGRYDEPLSSAREVRYDGSKPSFFNGRRHKNTTSALAIIALASGPFMENSLGQELENVHNTSEIVREEPSSIGVIALSDEVSVQHEQTRFEDMTAGLLVPDRTIVIQHVGSI